MDREKHVLRKPNTPLEAEKLAKTADHPPLAPRALVQRGAGNAAIQRAVIQRKAVGNGAVKPSVPINQPGDRSEREADQVAQKLLRADITTFGKDTIA